MMMILTFLSALGILELGLFVIGPALQNSMGPGAANLVYILMRVIAIAGMSFFAMHHFRGNLFKSLSLTGFLMFLDQVLFKSLWLSFEFKNNPKAWEGVELSSAIYNSAFSYIVSLPIILLIGFLGAMIAMRKNSKPRSLN